MYYSVYTQDGAIPSHRPIDPEDPYVACINLKRIAPPHTIASLKRSIAKNEKVVHHDHTVLYADMFQLSSMENGARVSAPGMFPGSTAAQPLAFVVLDPPSSQVEGRSLPSDQLLACMSASDQPAEPPSPIDMSTNIAPSVFSFATPGRKRR